MRVGVLALQGGYHAHGAAVAALGHEVVWVRYAEQLEAIDGLILPGGESTTHLKILAREGLEAPLDTFARSGKPLLVTCAGMILAARHVVEPAQRSFGWLDITVARNAWGRQLDSFEAVTGADHAAGSFDLSELPLVFIRAPRIREMGPEVEVLARFEGEPIMVRQGHIVGASFHPELTTDRRVHQLVFGDAT